MSDRHRDIPETAAETAARETIEVHDTFYRIGGERYTRVTTVLNIMDKPALVPWAFRTANETWVEELALMDKIDVAVNEGSIMIALQRVEKSTKAKREAASDAGRRAHDAIQRLTATGFAGLEEVEPDILPAVKAAQAFLRDYGLQVLATERTVWSSEHRVGGTIDLIATDAAENVYVIDWKRSKGLYPEHALQVAAYGSMLQTQVAEAVEEALSERHAFFHPVTGINAAPRLLVVRLPQEEGSYEVREVGFSDALSVYHAALNLYRTRRSVGKSVWIPQEGAPAVS